MINQNNEFEIGDLVYIDDGKYSKGIDINGRRVLLNEIKSCVIIGESSIGYRLLVTETNGSFAQICLFKTSVRKNK